MLGESGGSRHLDIALTPETGGQTTITLVVDDGTYRVQKSFELTVRATNDPPTLSVPPAVSVVSGAPVAVGPFVVADRDSGSGSLEMTFAISDGTLSLGTESGVTWVNGLNGSAAFTIRGTVAQLNTVCAASTFTPSAGFFDWGLVSVVVSDLGNTGSGGAQIARGSVSVQKVPLGMARRELAEEHRPGYGTRVGIEVEPEAGVGMFVVDELVPEGWAVGEISEGGVFDAGIRRVRWGPFTDDRVRTLQYTATSPSGVVGASDFAGTVYFDGHPVVTTGDVAILANRPPVLTAVDDVTIPWGSAVIINLKGSDPDGVRDRLIYEVLLGPEALKLDRDTGLLEWTPDPSDVGKVHEVAVQVVDSRLLPQSALQVFRITVTSKPLSNRAPILSPVVAQKVPVGTLWTYPLMATDPDLPATTLSYRLVSGPVGMQVNGQTGVLDWKPSEEEAGKVYDVIVEVNDNGVPALSARQSFRILIHEIEIPSLLEFLRLTTSQVLELKISGTKGSTQYILFSSDLKTWLPYAEVLMTSEKVTIQVPIEGGIQFYRLGVTGETNSAPVGVPLPPSMVRSAQ